MLVWGYTQEFAASVFETAKKLFNKSIENNVDLSEEIYEIEDHALEILCGTDNPNVGNIIMAFYTNVIDVKQLINSLTHYSHQVTVNK